MRMNLSRRELLAKGALAVGAVAVTGLRSARAAGDDVARDCIDAHSHVWTPDLKRYPLATGFTPADMQPASFTPGELMSHARPCGVSRVVLIQMSYYRFDNSYMLSAMRDSPGVFSGVAVIDESGPKLLNTLRDLKKQGVRGFRIHPGTRPVEPWLFSTEMATMWRHGADERLAMCALVNPEALGPLNKMCQRFPKTPLVIDHFARIGIDGNVRDADLDNLCRLARHEQTHVKISAFYALGQKKSPYLDLAPMIRRLLGAFGSKRLMWATDCPYQVQQGHTYCDSIDLVRSRLDFLTDHDRQWLMRNTAERVFFG